VGLVSGSFAPGRHNGYARTDLRVVL
jgi:hypothetical protein